MCKYMDLTKLPQWVGWPWSRRDGGIWWWIVSNLLALLCIVFCSIFIPRRISRPLYFSRRQLFLGQNQRIHVSCGLYSERYMYVNQETKFLWWDCPDIYISLVSWQQICVHQFVCITDRKEIQTGWDLIQKHSNVQYRTLTCWTAAPIHIMCLVLCKYDQLSDHTCTCMYIPTLVW